jgi:hypothetical protein
VLVIIGLLVGGVLVGQDLIRAAEVRAQVTQIEKYNSAVNTFKGKFNAIPGDMRPEIAQQFGFYVGTGCNGNGMGQRNGDGLLDGLGSGFQYYQGEGETAFFWQDISSSAAGSLIDGVFPNSGAAEPVCAYGGSALVLSGTGIGAWFPAAKIGHGDYLYVYDNNGSNWFGLSAVTSNTNNGVLYSNPNIAVSQAYKIDAKVDDGLPGTGNVQANYLNNNASVLFTAPTTTTSGGNSASCYDTTTGTYSITYNNGGGGNCALSFKMQGAGP